ncbi:MAG: phosphohistidine phosphatase SixA [Opitutaceae bacterium]|nr:phosphohistidine phosphatase SixA [Verrucomicrobiales bacterium]
MELYILRHGLAMDRADWSRRDDSDRPLTAEGLKKTRRIAKAMLKLDLKFDWILSSPYARARETAEIVAEVLKPKRQLELRHELTPDGSAKELAKLLAARPKTVERVLIVGHEPDLSQFISVLLTGKPVSRVVMKKGGLCKLQISQFRWGACAVIEWLLTPQQLIRID